MKVKKVSHILDDGHIDFYIEFNPFKLSSREVLVVNGNVIASTVYSRQRRQSVLNIDYFFAGKMHTITAISAPSPGGIKQGLQLRVDDEIVAGECELDLQQDDMPAMNEAIQQNIAARSVDVPFVFFNGRLGFLRLYALMILIFVLFNIKRRGPEFLTAMSADGAVFTLVFSFFLTGGILLIMQILRKWMKN